MAAGADGHVCVAALVVPRRCGDRRSACWSYRGELARCRWHRRARVLVRWRYRGGAATGGGAVEVIGGCELAQPATGPTGVAPVSVRWRCRGCGPPAAVASSAADDTDGREVA